MNATAVLVVLLLLVVIILVGNTMMAIAFLKGRKGDFNGVRGHDDAAIDELHQRVRELPPKSK
jgi:hypothetical protein